MKKRTYKNEMHFWGRLLGLTTAVAICLFPLLIVLIYKEGPNWGGVLKGLLGVAPLFWVVGIIEIFTYVPMFGTGASYLAFVTGNCANLKVPCVLNALESLLDPEPDFSTLVDPVTLLIKALTKAGPINAGNIDPAATPSPILLASLTIDFTSPLSNILAPLAGTADHPR